MNFFKYSAKKVWFQDGNIFIETTDGKQAFLPLKMFPRLNNASEKERQNYQLVGKGHALHWTLLDEDLSVAGFFES
jgi:hypothetical protein